MKHHNMCYIFGKLEVGFLVLDICGRMVTFCVGTLYNIHRSMDPLCISVRCHAAGGGHCQKLHLWISDLDIDNNAIL